MKNNGIERIIENYWDKDTFYTEYIGVLSNFLFIGDYYTLKQSKKIINNSDYSNTIKKNLSAFVEKINKYGMTGISKKYNRVTRNKYIKLLNDINVNPITFNTDNKDIVCIKNILRRAIEIAETKYFN